MRVPGIEGSILSNGTTAVWGRGVVGSWKGPLIRMLARSIPMNDIISVVMISFVPKPAFKIAGSERPGACDGSGHEEEERERQPEREVADEARGVTRDEGGAEQKLAVVPEVPNVGPEDDDQPGRDEQERRHRDRAVLPCSRSDAAVPDRPVERDRVAAERKQKERAGPQRQQNRADRADDHVEQALGPERACAPWPRRGDPAVCGGLDAHAALAPRLADHELAHPLGRTGPVDDRADEPAAREHGDPVAQLQSSSRSVEMTTAAPPPSATRG